MQENTNKDEIDDILNDIMKGKIYRNPTASRYSILCPSFGLVNCTKTFWAAKKWWYIRPRNIDGSSNHISVQWSNHFKVVNDTKKISHLVLKMEDNHLCILYFHHIHKHGGNPYPYFDSNEKNRGPVRSRLVIVWGKRGRKSVDGNQLLYQSKKGFR